jgi:ComF family protein
MAAKHADFPKPPSRVVASRRSKTQEVDMRESKKDVGGQSQARELARAMRDVQIQAKDMRRRVRVQRKASMLGWLEASMLGHRMPSAAGLIADAQWKRDEIDAYCWRCATTRAPFEDLERGCAECRDRPLGIHGVALRATVRLGRYAPPLSQWVPAIKQRAWRDMGITLGRELGMQVVDALTEGKLARPDVVVAVPVHWARRMLRGIDHCEIIAQEVARLTGLPMASPLKARLALRQTGSSRESRSDNQGRFLSRRQTLDRNQSHVLVVDDVRTTGSTLREVARALKQQGATDVTLAVCAAADPPRRNAMLRQ